MEMKKEKLKKKLKDANEKLVKTEEKYEKLLEVKKELDYYKKRVGKLAKMLSEL